MKNVQKAGTQRWKPMTIPSCIYRKRNRHKETNWLITNILIEIVIGFLANTHIPHVSPLVENGRGQKFTTCTMTLKHGHRTEGQQTKVTTPLDSKLEKKGPTI